MPVRSVSKHYLLAAGDGAGERVGDGADGVSKRVSQAVGYMWLHVRGPAG